MAPFCDQSNEKRKKAKVILVGGNWQKQAYGCDPQLLSEVIVVMAVVDGGGQKQQEHGRSNRTPQPCHLQA
ncbi:hypothetical protein TYRP_007507 [Tyrophagus putrescentiae]|nr:hypothetical protein TYRP_007507 [Tyrophagus putrescentiae]